MKIFSAGPNSGGSGSTQYLYGNILYIDGINGLDTNNGGPTSPYLTIQAALTAVGSAANATVFNAAATAYYIFKINPGTYTENLTIPSRQYIELQMHGVQLVGNIGYTFDGLTLGTGAISKSKLVINGGEQRTNHTGSGYPLSSSMTGTLTIGNTTSGLVDVDLSRFGVAGSITYAATPATFAGLLHLQNVYCLGTISAGAGSQITLYASDCNQSTSKALNILGNGVLLDKLSNVRFIGAVTPGSTTLTTANWWNTIFGATSDFTSVTMTVLADANSIASFYSAVTSGNRSGVTVTYADTSPGLGYTPTTSSNWNSVPATGLAALDTLATSGVVKTQTANTVSSGPTSGGAAVPAFRALVGADLPNPSSSTLGGVQSYAAVSNQWINSISTSGVPASTQPAFSNLSGNATIAQAGTNITSYTKGDTLYASATNVLSALSAGTTDQVWAQNSSGVPYWRNTITHRNELIFYEEWDAGANTGRNGWAAANSGTGSGAGNGTPVANRPGVILLTTGTTTTGYANRTAASGAGYFFGGGIFLAEMAVTFPTLSNATDEYIFRGLIGDSITGADNVDGVYFSYDRASNGNFWMCVTSSNSSRTTTVLDGGGGRATAAVTGAVYDTLSATVNAAGTSVVFSINDVAVATHTTNIPTTNARICASAFHIVKSAGTTAGTCNVDFNYCKQIFTTPR